LAAGGSMLCLNENDLLNAVTPLEKGWITKEQVMTMGKCIKAGQPPAGGETTLFKSVGMALFDLLTSDLIYRNAKEKGLGTNIDL
jgi:ornithine cyclodeaminase